MIIVAAVRSNFSQRSSRSGISDAALSSTARMFLKLVVAAVLFLPPTASGAETKNIVIVVIDDVGIERIGTYASEYGLPGAAPTPTINSIAGAGVRFDKFWAYPVCSPFRASLMTGLGPWDHGVGTIVKATENDDENNLVGLDSAQMNIARMLSDSGYRVEAIGKWHMAGWIDKNGALLTSDQVKHHPIASGFHRFDGSLFNPGRSVNNELEPGIEGYYAWERCSGETGNQVTCQEENQYSTEYITDKAIECIERDEANPLAPPFMCYVAYHAAHAPYNDPPMNLHDHAAEAEPCSNVGGFWVPKNVCHKAMIDALDNQLNRLNLAIDFDNTTLFVVSDNGTPNNAADGPYPSGHNKGTVYQGGLNTPLIVKGEMVTVPAGTKIDAVVQATDFFATLAEIAVSPVTIPEDSKSFMDYLKIPGAMPLRETVMAEYFVPNGLPANPIATTEIDDEFWLRASREKCYKLIWNYEEKVGTPDPIVTQDLFDLCGADEYTEETPVVIDSLDDEGEVAYVRLRAAIDEPYFTSDCVCEVQEIDTKKMAPETDPLIRLRQVATGGKGSSGVKKIEMLVRAVDAPGATCDPGEFSDITHINLKMEDESDNILVDSSKIIACEGGEDYHITRNVFFEGPKNCKNGWSPSMPDDGIITATGSSYGTFDKVQPFTIECAP